MVSKDTITGIVGAVVLVGAMVAVFVYEAANAPALTSADAPPGSELLPREVAASLTGCSFAEVRVDVPASSVTPHLPEGFTPVLSPTGMATLVLGGATCEEGSIGETNGSVGLGWLEVVVTPPAHVAGSGTDEQFFMLERFVLDDAYGATERELGANHTLLDGVEATVAVSGTHLYMTQGDATYHIVAPVAPQAPSQAIGDFTYREIVAAEGGFVYWQATLEAGAMFGMGPGMYETPEGTLARELLGASGRGGAVFATGGTLADAVVGFVPHGAATEPESAGG